MGVRETFLSSKGRRSDIFPEKKGKNNTFFIVILIYGLINFVKICPPPAASFFGKIFVEVL